MFPFNKNQKGEGLVEIVIGVFIILLLGAVMFGQTAIELETMQELVDETNNTALNETLVSLQDLQVDTVEKIRIPVVLSLIGAGLIVILGILRASRGGLGF